MDFDGCRVRYIAIGDGPPLLFLHGLGGKIEDNDACFPYLTSRFRVIAMDCPGSGFSDKPDREYTIDSLVEFCLEFATRVGLDRFYLCGGSQGGMKTLLCCLSAPERVIKAAVYSPSGVWPPNPGLAWLFRNLPPDAVRLFFQGASLFWNSPSYPDYWKNRGDSLEVLNTMELPGFGRHVFGCLASIFERDFRPIFAEVITPLLILWGKHDFGMPVAQGRELHKLIPASRFIEVPRSGHNVSIEMPEYFADEISSFFLDS